MAVSKWHLIKFRTYSQLLFDVVSPVVVFQFDGSVNISTAMTSENDTKGPDLTKTFEKNNNASYFDRLNSWLGQILQRDFPNVNLPIKLLFNLLTATLIAV